MPANPNPISAELDKQMNNNIADTAQGAIAAIAALYELKSKRGDAKAHYEAATIVTFDGWKGYCGGGLPRWAIDFVFLNFAEGEFVSKPR